MISCATWVGNHRLIEHGVTRNVDASNLQTTESKNTHTNQTQSEGIMEIQSVLSILDQDRRDARKLPANDWQYDEHNNAPYSKKNIPQNQRRWKDPHDTRRLFHRIYYGIRKNEPYTQCPPLPGQGCPVLESQFMALFPCQQEKATRPNLSRCSAFGLARCGGNTQKPFCQCVMYGSRKTDNPP